MLKFVTTRKFFQEAQITERVFKGYAAAYGNVDHDQDVIEPGAFAKSIKEAFPKGKIKVLYQHRDPLGMPIAMSEDSRGLYVEARISKTTLGDDVLELIKDGVINSMSVGFRLVKDKFDYNAHGVRHIREGVLMEFSPVTFPANEQAIITGIKALKEFSVYNEDRDISDRQRLELLDELKNCVALLERGRQPPLSTAHSLDVVAAQSMIKELGALALQFTRY